jgi:hypothetical protein
LLGANSHHRYQHPQQHQHHYTSVTTSPPSRHDGTNVTNNVTKNNLIHTHLKIIFYWNLTGVEIGVN